jgi:hypothetical protein
MEPLQMELRNINGIDEFCITKIGFKTDTFLYDVKKYMDRTFLLLISKNSSSFVYQLKDKNINIPQSNNITFPRFEIEGYAVGDEINRNDINIISKDQFGITLTEIAVLNSNENILFQVKSGLYIENIQWINIEDQQAQGMAQNINKIFTRAPDSQYIDGASDGDQNELISYFWSENEVNILLSKTNETGDPDNSWTLTCTNLIISNILNNYLDVQQENL